VTCTGAKDRDSWLGLRFEGLFPAKEDAPRDRLRSRVGRPEHRPTGETLTRRFTSVEDGMNLYVYWTTKCGDCPLKSRCTSGKERRIKRWEHESVIDAMQERLDRRSDAMRIRRATVEHAFGTLKAWMGATHFRTRTLDKVRTEMSLHVLAYNLKRVVAMLGPQSLIEAIRA